MTQIQDVVYSLQSASRQAAIDPRKLTENDTVAVDSRIMHVPTSPFRWCTFARQRLDSYTCGLSAHHWLQSAVGIHPSMMTDPDSFPTSGWPLYGLSQAILEHERSEA